MAREKQKAPLQRIPSSGIMQSPPDLPEVQTRGPSGSSIGPATVSPPANSHSTENAGLLQLVICVAGIYASFLSWGVLQETITTTDWPVRSLTAHDPHPPTERFTFSVVLNTIQSFFAAITGFLYLYFSTPRNQKRLPVFPTRRILIPLILVSVSSSLASPFGYASLAHIDYLTFILAKSCKLLPVMFLHLTIFQKRYPLYKYGVILLVTLGVATFTLHHPSSRKKKHNNNNTDSSSAFGLFLLSINLLLDGLTNTTQDHIFSSPNIYSKFTGPQMMVAQNVLSTMLTSCYLILIPHISSSILPLLPLPVPPSQTNELSSALSFLSRHPHATKDVVAFAACGAIGQLFIFYTLAHFSSLLLVTVTVTRKMLTMLLSVVWFGHRLTGGQWLGVGLVFGGIGAEAIVQKKEKAKKMREKEKSQNGVATKGEKEL
ncbi:UDP-Glc/Gal endoplasmic reticulum nucleotide sugar transporter [Coccidioides immitis RS]|uniref:UDP-galactose transporter homolog 1 n=2 Tax=Coccidioides immitis TaxID=5501 RepID=J3KCE7_COCIM|nr:UDP-Glc/Gal endoplasmic reticulum nucleotide sugar transporter [Coccidioides immitis RS]EAS32903.3 UDP-Glc/Gal endoplasmic reticulum nucleotide sugar transporter [Coccidioides immitis RS]KMU89884.1 solute carrier family 35 member B1 [Coccidioides immitis H538.4]TPX19878.1 UDP-galactose transporter [Coccidioides immitis]